MTLKPILDLDVFDSQTLQSHFFLGKIVRIKGTLPVWKILEKPGKPLVASVFLGQHQLTNLYLELDVPAILRRPIKGLAHRIVQIDQGSRFVGTLKLKAGGMCP